MISWGLARRLYTAEGLLASACLLSLGFLLWSSERRETAVQNAMAWTTYSGSLETAAQSCRNYLSLVLGAKGLPGARSAGEQALKRLRASRGRAMRAGGASAGDVERLSRFVQATQKLLDRMDRLEREGRLKDSAALYEKGVRPLAEQYLAGSLERRVREDRIKNLQSLRHSLTWRRLSAWAAAAFAASSLVLFALWSRRFAQYLLRNVDRIRRTMAAIGSGNFSVFLRPERRDEMGRLSLSLNEMAARLEQTQKRLVETERRAAYGELASGAAHALNNPLSAIIAVASLMLDQEEWKAQERRDLRMILQEAKRCDQVLRNLSQFSGAQGAKALVQVNDLIQKMGGLLGPNFEPRGVRLELTLDPGLPFVKANSRELQQVLYNLIMNAFQAVKAPGGRIAVTTLKMFGWVSVSVEDDGEGIAPESLEKIFEPFFTTRPPEEGIGLGLSSARAIIEEHGGQIGVESSTGKGSRFELRLPAAPPGESPPPEEAKGGGRVLVVDDERNILDVADRVLRREGFEVECVCDAREALGAVKGGGFDLILSDYCMPGLDGRELYEVLRREHPGMADRFVFTTGEIISKDFQAFADKNGIPVVLKPFDLDELVRTVRGRVSQAGRAGVGAAGD